MLINIKILYENKYKIKNTYKYEKKNYKRLNTNIKSLKE